MSPSVEDFIACFPEFCSAFETNPRMVESALEGARAVVGEAAWGSAFQRGLYLYTAHSLAMSPFAENLRLSSDKTSSPYWAEYALMRDTRSPHVAVSGGGSCYPYNWYGDSSGWF